MDGKNLTMETLSAIYSQIKKETKCIHFYGKHGEARVMYSSMAELQKGLELAMKTDSFGLGKSLNVEILQWHSNNPFYGEYFNESHFERELKKAKNVSESQKGTESEKINIEEIKIKNNNGLIKSKAEPIQVQNELDKKLDLKKKMQKLQRSMDKWETIQHTEEVPELVIKPISQTPKKIEIKMIEIEEPEPTKTEEQKPNEISSIPIIQFDLIPISNEPIQTETKEKQITKENGTPKKTKIIKKKKLTFFNSDEEKQQRDTFTESKDTFELYLDSLAEQSENKNQFVKCYLCKVTFESALDLSVHKAFDNAHKIILKDRLECVSFQRV
jgi:hypothetical protein